ncbi:hypothetical protein RF679_01860 [Undibacterium cyanobacteriorum]|uniref:Thioredoxin domain-containing protein n=1 Tax=Undibacterium cyanobacteriorum TaxID=3073561 RepID=A0ABY9RK34_9BURK|nr:hypothetical protein [Undibacterium sp. 20NA77.5]WMW81039.1 hypothetical protein RF679_01860 [Undibacterium sp. 20NA77.5]
MRRHLKAPWAIPAFIFPILLLGANPSSHAQDAKVDSISKASSASNPSTVLKSRAELDQYLAQGPNVLDQLTPYSRGQLLRNVEWRNGQVSRFDFPVPIEELDQESARQVYALFGIERFFPEKFPEGNPLRYEDVSATHELLLQQLRDALRRDQANEKQGDQKEMWIATERFYQQQLSPLLKPSNLRLTSRGNLLVLFKVVDEVNFMTRRSAAFHDLNHVHQELSRRGIDTRRNLDERLLKHMLTQRDFDGARALVASRPHLSDVIVPKVVGKKTQQSTRLTVLAEKNGELYTQALLTGNDKAQVLLVVSEHCGFCRKLFADMEADPQLSARFARAKLVLISALENGIPVNFVREWNQKNPQLPMYMPGKEEQWKAIDSQGWPQFVFMRNGKVESRIQGWRNDGSSKESIIQAFEKAGL